VQEPWQQKLLEEMLRHRGKVIGTLLGLLFAGIVIALGLLRALFVVVCVAMGFFIGARLDEVEAVSWPAAGRLSRRWHRGGPKL
jgi:uncharacterized membrane protein